MVTQLGKLLGEDRNSNLDNTARLRDDFEGIDYFENYTEKFNINVYNIIETKETVSGSGLFILGNSDTGLLGSSYLGSGGEIFILKMPVVKLGDLSDVIIDHFSKKYGVKKENIKKKIVGPRVGEKIYEELMTEVEAKKAFETNDMLIIPPQIVLPTLKFEVTDYKGAKSCTLKRYVSKDVSPLSKNEIKKMLFW